MGRLIRSWQYTVPFLLLVVAFAASALIMPSLVRPASDAPPASPSVVSSPSNDLPTALPAAAAVAPDVTGTPVPGSLTPIVGSDEADSDEADLSLLLTPAAPPPTTTPTPAPAEQARGQLPLPTADGSKLTSVLLMGYGGPGHPGMYLTDAMILAVLNPSQKTLMLLSVPRDTWVYLPIRGTEGAWGKLNTAYAYGVNDLLFTNKLARYSGKAGGGNLAKDVTSQILDYPIQSYAALDFATFAKAIDEIGGVDIDIPHSFSSNYASFQAGHQHLNGAKALDYARSRMVYDYPPEANDFARSRRQRQIITAFTRKLTTPESLLHLVPLLRLANEGMSTDYHLPAVGELPGLVGSLRDLRIFEASLTSSDYLRSSTGPNGTYILLPAAGAGQWGQVRGLVKTLVADPELGRAIASHEIDVVNGTDGANAAALEGYLESGGYRVRAVRKAPTQASTTIVAAQEDAVLAEGLRAAFGRDGVAATVALTGQGNPIVTFGADWQARQR